MSSVPAPSSRVVDAVARSKKIDPTALPPLYETIDPDALDAILSSGANGPRADGDAIRVQFTYADRHVVIRSSGDVEVRKLDSGRDNASTT